MQKCIQDIYFSFRTRILQPVRPQVVQYDSAKRASAQDAVNLDQLEIVNEEHQAAAASQNKVFQMEENIAYKTVNLPIEHHDDDDDDYEYVVP